MIKPYGTMNPDLNNSLWFIFCYVGPYYVLEILQRSMKKELKHEKT